MGLKLQESSRSTSRMKRSTPTAISSSFFMASTILLEVPILKVVLNGWISSLLHLYRELPTILPLDFTFFSRL
uniref:Uncharacterized protein n=1 Tax=Arundo donax TaxID=35708 RepID=A0A0A9CGT5_ARUDO